jgi:transcriptional regulator GlxA family with amidase domain
MKKIFFSLTTLFLAFISPSLNAQEKTAAEVVRFDKSKKINVAFLVFDQVEALDLNGPVDIFAKASQITGSYNLYTVSPTDREIQSEGNVMNIKAGYSFSNAPQADILIIPGAFPPTIKALIENHPEIGNWIKTQHQATEVTMSICTGAILLASEGLLDGKYATTHYGAIDLLKANKKIKVLENIRYKQDGKILTTGGITSGLDGSLHLIELINGKQVADEIARILVYNRNGDMDFTGSAKK